MYMIRTPCEYMMWNGVPVIRKEIAESMITHFGLNQKEAAEKLGVTPAAVCQYISKKRGKIKIVDNEILVEIKLSAERIIKHSESVVTNETCRICKIMQNKGIFPYHCENCNLDE
jgi:predicted transcriptional regulator